MTSARQQGASPNAGTLDRRTLSVASPPHFPEVSRLPLARLARSREGASWRCTDEPSWLTPPSRSPLPVLPVLALPVGAAVPCSKGLGKGSHRPENLAFAVRTHYFWWCLAAADMDLRLGFLKNIFLRDEHFLFLERLIFSLF